MFPAGHCWGVVARGGGEARLGHSLPAVLWGLPPPPVPWSSLVTVTPGVGWGRCTKVLSTQKPKKGQQGFLWEPEAAVEGGCSPPGSPSLGFCCKGGFQEECRVLCLSPGSLGIVRSATKSCSVMRRPYATLSLPSVCSRAGPRASSAKARLSWASRYCRGHWVGEGGGLTRLSGEGAAAGWWCSQVDWEEVLGLILCATCSQSVVRKTLLSWALGGGI